MTGCTMSSLCHEDTENDSEQRIHSDILAAGIELRTAPMQRRRDWARVVICTSIRGGTDGAVENPKIRYR